MRGCGGFTRYGASLLAFGHLSGMYGARSGRHRKAKPVYVPPAEPAVDKDEVTYESHPEIYRALNPVFDGRQRSAPIAHKAEPSQTEQPKPARQEAVQEVQQPAPVKPAATWTWEI